MEIDPATQEHKWETNVYIFFPKRNNKISDFSNECFQF